MLSRVGKMLPSLSGGGLYGAGYPAGQVLGGETSGFAIDFTSPGANLLMRSGTIPGNYVGYPFVREGGPVAFSRASNATVTDADGKIKWAAHNLLTNSESFDASAWVKSSVTVTANYALAPNGTQTADRAVYAGGAGTPSTKQIYQGVSDNTANRTYVFGVWVSGTGKFRLKNTHSGVADTYTADITATSTPTLYTLSVTNNATNGGAQVGGVVAATTDDAFDLNLWGAALYRSDLGGMVANTSAYPMYNPTTPKNLLGYTEAFDNAAWVKVTSGTGSAAVVTANDALGPNGLQTADKVDFNRGAGNTTTDRSSLVFSSILTVSGTPYRLSFWIKAATAGDVGKQVAYRSVAGGGYTTVTLASDWVRVSVSETAVSTSSNIEIGSRGTYNTDNAVSVHLWGAQLSDSASLDTYVPNYFAAPTAAAYYGPRLDYDGSTLAAKGLLVEEQRSNVVLLNGMTSVTGSAGSQYPNATGWANEFNTGGTRTYVASNAVPGFNAIDISNVSNARNLISFSFSAASSTTYSVSFYIESLNGVTGAISYAVGALGTGGTSNIISSPTSTGRVSYTFTTGTGAGTVTIRLGIGVAQNQNGSIRISGLQVEAGSFSTSLIPTTSASVTRSADVAQVSTQAFPYSATEGAVVAAFAPFIVNNNFVSVSLTDGTNSNRFYSTTGTIEHLVVTAGGVAQAAIDAGTITASAVNKTGFAFASNNFAAVIDGGSVATDTAGTVPVVSQMFIGNYNAISSYLNGHIRQITYIPRRLTNAELQSRTA